MKKIVRIVAGILLVSVAIAMFTSNVIRSEERQLSTNPTNETTMMPVVTPAPVVTSAPTAMVANVQVKVDRNGKQYYESTSDTLVEEYVRKNVTASVAVDAIRCEELGASYVYGHKNDYLLTAYDLLTEQDDMFYFVRNQSTLLGYNPARADEFRVSEEEVRFHGFSDGKAEQAWLCKDHMSIYSSTISMKGYPNAIDGIGDFSIRKGFAREILKAIRLVKTGENRYDWVMVTCDCNPNVTSSGSGSGGGNTKPSQTEKPTAEPTQKPTVEPTKRPENNPMSPTATKAPENNPMSPSLPTLRPESNIGGGNVSTDDDPFENTDSSEDNEIESSNRPSMGGSTGSNSTGSGNISTDEDPFA